ncbi:MAG: response regulator [Humidesulfovibrio sp.]|nr:response regulator [Humidesulfovibrio sp.]
MSEKILFVDDEINVLDAFRANLRKRFDVTTALGPEEGLKLLQESGPFAVVISDLKMPKMDGITFLTQVRELSVDTVRMMITGFADVEVAIGAVNEGQVFRFLTKPCPPATLTKALAAGLEQYRLVTAERELLRGTLRGSIRVLTEALSLANPEAYGRSERVRVLVRKLVKSAGLKNAWELELAAMLSHIGCMALPRILLENIAAGKELTTEERKLYASHPAVGAGLIEHIPRLGKVAEIIANQHKRLDPQMPEGARVLKIAVDYNMLESKGLAPQHIFVRMRSCAGCYDPGILDKFEKAIGLEGDYIRKNVSVKELTENMILEENVKTQEGLLLLAKGMELNEASIYRLIQAGKTFNIIEPISVLIAPEAGQPVEL